MNFALHFKKSFINYFQMTTLICSLSLLFCSSDKNDIVNTKIAFTVDSKTARFISNKDYSLKDPVFMPVKMLQHHITNEQLVLDMGNNALYFFDNKGGFIKKIGGEGQGPGDLLRPFYMQINKNGDIYVYEGGNYRISIFDKTGKFKNSFRAPIIHYQDRSKFVIDNNNNVVFSLPKRKHYITAVDQNGNYKDYNIINSFGGDSKRDQEVDKIFAEAYQFFDSNGNIILFLSHLPKVIVYGINGKILFEKELDDVINKNDYSDPRKPGYKELSFTYFYHDIYQTKEHYYLLRFYQMIDGKRKLRLIKIDNNYELINNMDIIFDGEIQYTHTEPPNIFVSEDELNLFISIPKESEVIKIPLNF